MTATRSSIRDPTVILTTGGVAVVGEEDEVGGTEDEEGERVGVVGQTRGAAAAEVA